MFAMQVSGPIPNFPIHRICTHGPWTGTKPVKPAWPDDSQTPCSPPPLCNSTTTCQDFLLKPFFSSFISTTTCQDHGKKTFTGIPMTPKLKGSDTEDDREKQLPAANRMTKQNQKQKLYAVQFPSAPLLNLLLNSNSACAREKKLKQHWHQQNQ